MGDGPRIVGAEPALGDDVARSVAAGRVVMLDAPPATLADGAMTLACAPNTLQYLTQADAIDTVTELEIVGAASKCSCDLYFRLVQSRVAAGIRVIKPHDHNPPMQKYWTQWLTHLLKITVEPTSAMAAASAVRYLRDLPPPSSSSPSNAGGGSDNGLRVDKKTCLIVLSGGNLSTDTRHKVWAEDYLTFPPEL